MGDVGYCAALAHAEIAGRCVDAEIVLAGNGLNAFFGLLLDEGTVV